VTSVLIPQTLTVAGKAYRSRDGGGSWVQDYVRSETIYLRRLGRLTDVVERVEGFTAYAGRVERTDGDVGVARLLTGQRPLVVFDRRKIQNDVLAITGEYVLFAALVDCGACLRSGLVWTLKTE
jgi:hypothetical protein